MEVRLVQGRRIGEKLLDQQQSAVGGHGGATSVEDAGGAFVVPVVQDPFEQIQVRSGGDGVEEVAEGDGATVGKPGGTNVLGCPVRALGIVEDDSAQLRVALRDGNEQSTVSAADVDHAGATIEVVTVANGPAHRCAGLPNAGC
ncbi:hypothetical protein NDR87_21860 [Nocardia sp. CDC159]|uniref:Uncharacterized protein n=1 Tax=Nocardia pulmonis TaxID=2951408 RepID=A0A9X2EE61_9NOCA|nr:MULTISPECIES: hypothetical protein [Nocardia]MCM6776593.1 hypothetical protein [Nocardia pulmonis]MCM6789017.1 hypothetical protein [Nocardia sp. CDC159]